MAATCFGADSPKCTCDPHFSGDSCRVHTPQDGTIVAKVERPEGCLPNKSAHVEIKYPKSGKAIKFNLERNGLNSLGYLIAVRGGVAVLKKMGVFRDLNQVNKMLGVGDLARWS